MNTNNLKRFAKEARIKLLDQVGRKLEFVLTHDTAELRGKQKEIEQLKKKIAEQGEEQVIEMVAYTWFNRLMALRFMDANDYTIPKVITPLEGMTNPELLQNALGGNIEPELKLDRQRLNDLLDGKTAATDAHTEAYKMLLVASCNQWHTAMPFMFERISDYTELLLPDDLLSDYSIVADIRNGMSDEDCQQEELIGWLYQFYIADKKDDVFEGLKKNIKITAENIPAATQLFTPRWIVRYMVENTLGKLWLTIKPNSKLRQHMSYYIEAPDGNNPAPLPEEIKGVTDITFLDPCQGSGHVLVYAFDLFTKIYEEEGYNTNEIPALILEHNLFGIDIDERAAQLAAFALTMKARSYFSRFLRKPVQPHVIALENVNEDIIKQGVKLPLAVAGKLVYDYRDLTLYNLTQADNFGSLIQIDPEELKSLSIQKGSIWQVQEQKLKEQGEYLSRQYHCVVTNPPYMGIGGMNVILSDFVKKVYSKSKSDLMTCFMERSGYFLSNNGFYSMINFTSWMFLSSFEEIRKDVVCNFFIQNLIHQGRGIFGSDFGTVCFSIQKNSPNNKKGVYRRLFKEHVKVDSIEEKENRFFNKNYGYFISDQSNFKLIPGSPIGYWLSVESIKAFEGLKVREKAISEGQNITGNNEKYIRSIWEVSRNKISKGGKWVITAKGGNFKKWYGNFTDVVDWSETARQEYRANPIARIQSEHLWFRVGISWNLINYGAGFRILEDDKLFNKATPTILFNKTDEKYIPTLLGFLNSSVAEEFLNVLNPTVNTNILEVLSLPFDYKVDNEIDIIVKRLIEISKNDWNSQEFSFEYKTDQVLNHSRLVNQNILKSILNTVFELNENINEEARLLEIDLNKHYLVKYKLDKELLHDVKIENVSLENNVCYLSRTNIIKEDRLLVTTLRLLSDLISFVVGSLLGRYSLDKPGLILASQGETLQDFFKQIPSPTFLPDEDNIIPVLEGEWFTDDIVGRFKVFLKAAFGEEHFEENLKYIEETIGKDIRKYFVKDFYNDHIKRYKKRPIYWMFSSPKGHFKALIYMHRYQPDLCSKMLNDYLQAFISKLEAAKQTQTMLSLREDISAREKTLGIKEIDKYEAMLKDCREYEKTLFAIATQKISIDLDDGVKVNYQKFKEVLVPIKGLEKEEE